mgnify:FL=1
MRKLLNSLFILTEKSYLSLNGENIVVSEGENELGRYPLHTLESIFYFGYKGASPALMGACCKKHINLVFLTPSGKFLAKVAGMTQGNVLLRKIQYGVSEDPVKSCLIARNFITGKIFNSKWVLERATRDHPHRVDVEFLKNISSELSSIMLNASNCTDLARLRGFEGEAANLYFDALDGLILQNKDEFYMTRRSRRPPLDKLNALLSFTYGLLMQDCMYALESVGLDPYVGFLHRDRPGRSSLALDLMEELRSVVADRFVISMINTREIKVEHFITKENESVFLTEEGRRLVIRKWQSRKKDEIIHPYLAEKIPWGLVPYAQSLLLNRHLRGDIDGYPPFLWK